MEPEVYIRALRVLHCFLIKGKDSARNAICQYMALSNTEYFPKIISLIIIRISQLMCVFRQIMLTLTSDRSITIETPKFRNGGYFLSLGQNSSTRTMSISSGQMQFCRSSIHLSEQLETTRASYL